MAKSLFNSLNEKKETEKPYNGDITFTNKAIIFGGTTVLLNNVSQFNKYGLTWINRITDLQLALAALLGIGSLFFLPFGLIVTVPALFIVYVGIKERRRPKLYGLTIELNSGSSHYFLSKDLDGVTKLFSLITKAINSDSPFTLAFRYEDNRVTNIQHSSIGVVGDHASVNNIDNGKKVSHEQV